MFESSISTLVYTESLSNRLAVTSTHVYTHNLCLALHVSYLLAIIDLPINVRYTSLFLQHYLLNRNILCGKVHHLVSKRLCDLLKRLLLRFPTHSLVCVSVMK